MPLSALGGFAQGVNEGLRGLATIRSIQKSREDEERAKRTDARQLVEQGQRDTTFGQQQAEYKRLHDRTIDPAAVIDSMGLDDEGKKYVETSVKPFLPEGGKVSLADIETIKANVLKDPKFVSEVTGHRRRVLGNQIASMRDELSTLGAESGGLGQVYAYNQKKSALDQAETRMRELDPTWDKKADNARKDKELGLKEREVAVKEKGDRAISNLAAMRDKLNSMPEGLAKEAYKRAIKEQEDFEIREKRVAHEGDVAKQTAIDMAREKRAAEAAKKTATTQNINAVNKFYSDLEKSTKQRIKDLQSGEADDPNFDTAKSIAAHREILRNIPVYHANDLKAVQGGNEPPNVKNLSGERSAPAEKPIAEKPAAAKKVAAPPQTRKAKDDKGNVWEVDATGKPIRMITPVAEKKVSGATREIPQEPPAEESALEKSLREKRAEERALAAKRLKGLAGIIPKFGNNIDPRLSY